MLQLHLQLGVCPWQCFHVLEPAPACRWNYEAAKSFERVKPQYVSERGFGIVPQ